MIAIARRPRCSPALNPVLRGCALLVDASGGWRWRSSAPCSSWSPAPRRCTPTWAISAAGRCRLAWLALVWPALLLNYFGQGALLLTDRPRAPNPFYALAPAAALPALVLLATAATIIASQATISGAFSVTRQAVQLDLLPRVRDPADLGATTHGQIYVPAANLFMFVAVVAVRHRFRLLERAVGRLRRLGGRHDADHDDARRRHRARTWRWPLWRVVAVFGLILLIDVLFVAGNATKIASGGGCRSRSRSLMFGGVPHLARGTRCACAARCSETRSALPELPELLARVAGAGHGRVSRQQRRLRADRAAAQPRTQPRAPRAHRDPALRDPAHAARRPAAPRALEELWPGVVRRARASSASWRRRTSAKPCAAPVSRACACRRGLSPTSSAGTWCAPATAPAGRACACGCSRCLQRRSAQAAEFFLMPQDGVVMLGTEVDI